MNKIALAIGFVFLALLVGHSPAGSTVLPPLAAPAAASTFSFEAAIVGGATADAVYVEGDYAYLCLGDGLVIMDISNPARPVQVSSLIPPEGYLMFDLVKVGPRVYAVGWNDLYIIDVADATRPYLLGIYAAGAGGSILSVAVAGDYAYVGYAQGFHVVDISDPRHPAGVWDDWNLWGIWDASVQGSYLYLALAEYESDFNGLAVFDLADPASPVLVAQPAESYIYPAYGLAVAGNYAYLAQGGLRIYDISNPAAPSVVGYCNCAGGDLARRVAIQGDYAYVAAAEYGLAVIDIANPVNPQQVAVYDPHPGEYLAAREARVAGGYAYLAVSNPAGLDIADVSNPASPARAGSAIGPGAARDLVLTSQYAYVKDDLGLIVLERTGAGQLTAVGYEEIVGESWGLAVQYPYAYIANRVQGLAIADVSDPRHPSLVTSYAIDGDPMRVAVAGPYVYVTDYYSGSLHILDASDPLLPVEVGKLDFEYAFHPVDVLVAGSYAYVTASSLVSGLRIVDISDPGQPFIVGGYTSSVAHDEIVIRGRYAYLAAYNVPSLRIWDITNPYLPVFIGSGETPELQCTRLDISGDYVFLTNYNSLFLFDIADPAHPALVGQTVNNLYPRSVRVDGNYVYMSRTGLLLLRVAQEAVSAAIPPAGGSLASAAGDVQLAFPSGVFTQTAAASYTRLLADQDTGGLLGIGATFELAAVYSDTLTPVVLAPGAAFTLTVTYTPTQLGGVIEDSLALYYWEAGQWAPAPGSSLDIPNRTLTAAADRFGLWAVLGGTRRTYLPAIWR